MAAGALGRQWAAGPPDFVGDVRTAARQALPVIDILKACVALDIPSLCSHRPAWNEHGAWLAEKRGSGAGIVRCSHRDRCYLFMILGEIVLKAWV